MVGCFIHAILFTGFTCLFLNFPFGTLTVLTGFWFGRGNKCSFYTFCAGGVFVAYFDYYWISATFWVERDKVFLTMGGFRRCLDAL